MDERVRRTLASYERNADEYSDLHDDRSVVAEQVATFAGVVDGEGVLDVGCGPGWETATFADCGLDPVGVDLSPAFLARASERTDVPFARADMRALPFAADTFDGVWAMASVLHVPRDEVPDTLREFRRVLVDGGVLYFSVHGDPERDTGEGPYERDVRHFEPYSLAEARTLTADAGFDVEDVDGEADDWISVLARA